MLAQILELASLLVYSSICYDIQELVRESSLVVLLRHRWAGQRKLARW